MRILIGCESSGTVRDAFAALGHDAWSCDLLDTVKPGQHIKGDVLEAAYGQRWDVFIAHPPCTYMSSSGLHWNKRVPGRSEKTAEAVRFALACWDAPVRHVAMENPIGRLGPVMREQFGIKPQIVQPYQFGHNASKSTCLWLRDLPPLTPTQYVEPRIVNGKPRWANQTDSGQNALGPSPDRWRIRSVTYQGIADAMARQWHLYLTTMKEAA